MTQHPSRCNGPRRAITILGAGHIGFAMALLLRQAGDYDILVADRDPACLARAAALGVATQQTSDAAGWLAAIQGRFAVLDALPFHCAVQVATLCVQAGVHYFDLTEDVPSTRAIRALAAGARQVLMPQCGLAPGFIGIVGHDLARRFESLHSLRLRVGALPRYPQGALRYNLTWSTEGLINEYCKPCEAIVDGARSTVAALEGLERFALDGVEYESFNTSGGLGTLTETLAGRVRQLDYQSIRYPGHCAILKLLLDDLRLRERRDLLKDILEAAIPSTDQDVVVVFATASGLRGGRLVQDSYCSRIVGAEVAGHTLSAIQRTTAAGICTALDLVAQGRLPQKGFVGQEAVALGDFLANRFGAAYAGACVGEDVAA
ncbi:saccharopine dehydrogenase family protein [Verminephrobacter aporrectodeae subsp. tuberculatae]|uniref:saccharopine dehydrogenase family protein n=1 Tax=Verminephrobacter aporrectodeae TaxID=1110389 RepID=UPI0022437536|nr:saccharopine dehydrogenase C-terminal domain-containing protein [Verminephrobacter aporrectodeae]MCW8197329.1 saccharopine dehydrogenase family protein [Verminephrobacter aporrectodeae subsp. tuberculatae]